MIMLQKDLNKQMQKKNQNKLTFILTTFSQYGNWVLAKAKDKYFIYFPKSTCNKLIPYSNDVILQFTIWYIIFTS